MTPPDTPRPDDKQPPPEPTGEEAARLFEVGLSSVSGAPSSAPSPAEVQSWFPGLEILEVLGQGGMGVVYKARQKTLDRVVALKVLPESLSKDPAFAERFTREARTLAKLQHPHIVGVHEFGDVDGRYYLLMEYVDGVNLRQLMDTRSLVAGEALAIVPQICEALQYAHDQGVVHRDIKPENVMLDRGGKVKVADFGLAKLTERGPSDFTLTGTGQVMGTLQYMAPEQYKTPQDVDHRADIFSLGVVFYEMLTGELPVGRFANPTEGTDLDARLDEIVMKTLERERTLRFQKAEDVKSEVATVTSGAAPAEGAFSRMHERHARRATRHSDGTRRWSRWALWSLAAIPLAALLGAVAYAAVEGLSRNDNGSWKAYHATVAGFWTAAVGFMVAALIAIVAIVLTSKYKHRLNGQTLSIVCLVVALLLIPMTIAVGDAQLLRTIRYPHMNSFPSPIRPVDALTKASVKVEGARSWQAGHAIRDQIFETWIRYCTEVRNHDLRLGDVPGLYTREDWIQMRALSIDELDARIDDHTAGMAFVGQDHLPIPPWELALSKIEVDDWERTATVTAIKRGPLRMNAGDTVPMGTSARPALRVTFRMKRDDGKWLFVPGPVTIEMSDPDYHPEDDDR